MEAIVLFILFIIGMYLGLTEKTRLESDETYEKILKELDK
jgi:hypothetical protein